MRQYSENIIASKQKTTDNQPFLNESKLYFDPVLTDDPEKKKLYHVSHMTFGTTNQNRCNKILTHTPPRKESAE